MRARTKVIAVVASLVLALVLVAAVLLAVYHEPDGRYRATVLNVGSASVTGGMLTLDAYHARKDYRIPVLRPGESAVFEGRVRGDCDYLLTVTRESGVASMDRLGYLTRGASSDDTILVADSSSSLPNSHWSIP